VCDDLDACIFTEISFIMRLLLFSLLFSAHALIAQDYLITTKGDTLKGSIVFQLNGKIESATVKGQKRETISAIGVREVKMKSRRFKPVQFNGSVLFMEILTEGYLSLLAFQPPNLLSYEGRLLQKRDGKILEVPTLAFKRQMVAYLSDYPKLSKMIQADELDRKDLNEIIKQYNDFILGATENQNAQVKIESNQRSVLESIELLKSEIEKSDLPLKQDALDILADWAEKIKNKKTAMPYMIKSLNAALEPRNDLLEKLNAITGN
jgi:hypothetical protein